jgi:hypothetical protein
MFCLSILFGYYTLDVYKIFGLQGSKIDDDIYLTEVGSIAGLFGSFRFVWSMALDKFSFRKVYGTLLGL